MTADAGRPAFDWEAEGRRVGARLGHAHAVVVAGADPVETARVALGIARSQAGHRRVALGDLLGDAEPLRRLAPVTDPHGLVDSFLYGVSLNKIAARVSEEGELFLLPTGTEPPAYRELLPNARWRRLSAGFREVGALLVLAVPADAPELEALIAVTDGAVMVGDAGLGVPSAYLIATVRQPRQTRQGEAPNTRRPPVAAPWWRKRLGMSGGLALAGLLAVVALWLAYRPLAGRNMRRPLRGSDTSAVAATLAPVDTARADSGSTTPVAAEIPLVNPADSGMSAGFAVAVTNANTEAGAILHLQQNGRALPVTTYAPVLLQGMRWFRVTTGAFNTARSADSLLASLRELGVLDQRSGSVIRAPFAFLIDSEIAKSAAPAVVGTLIARGQPAYGLVQADGRVRVYVGAFETPAQAGLFMASLRAAGIEPVLAYRTGRVF